MQAYGRSSRRGKQAFSLMVGRYHGPRPAGSSFVLIATLSLFLAFMAAMGVIDDRDRADHPARHRPGRRLVDSTRSIGKLIKQADYALLATVL